MALRDLLNVSIPLTVKDLQRFQRAYDERFIAEEFEGFDKIRHTYAHMGKLFGRLAEYVQMIEDGYEDFSPEDIKTKVIPDLLVYSAWLAAEFSVDMEEAYVRRFVGNIERLHSDKIPADDLDGLKRHVAKRFG
jgi:hypothetical protein